MNSFDGSKIPNSGFKIIRKGENKKVRFSKCQNPRIDL